jgi:uncharacterized membrane protein
MFFSEKLESDTASAQSPVALRALVMLKEKVLLFTELMSKVTFWYVSELAQEAGAMATLIAMMARATRTVLNFMMVPFIKNVGVADILVWVISRSDARLKVV